ncbi:MAG: hypothetical protein ACI83O_000455 [Patescibacteria group bacterium]|jgi:hypothetical protein
MNRYDKRGDVVSENLLGLILAVVGIFIIGTIFFALFTPSFDARSEALDGYFDSLEESVEVARQKGIGDFSTFILPNLEERTFLVYFGEKRVFDYLPDEDRLYRFSLDTYVPNTLCVCSADSVAESTCDKAIAVYGTPDDFSGKVCYADCNRCLVLDAPAVFNTDVTLIDLENDSSFVIRSGQESGSKQYFFEVAK